MSTENQEQQAFEALIDTYADADGARLVLDLAGFPASRIPAFSTSMVFWHRVASDARNGLLPGGLRPIFEQAAKQFPFNPAFGPYAPPTASTRAPPSTAPAVTSTKPAHPRIRIFISYSYADERYRERLETHLKGIERLLPIEFWHERKMLAGTKLADAILAQLAVADVVLLLVSPDFMASDYCFSIEMGEALKKFEQNKGLPVRIIIRPENTWFDHKIGQLLALPKDGKAISKWPDPDDAWEDVSRGLKALLTNLAQKRGLLPS